MLALLMGALLFGLVNLLVALPVVVYEVVTGARSSERLAEGEIVVTPLLFAATTLADNARFFDSIDDVPKHCLTQGLGTIMDARNVILVATGTNKAHAIAQVIEGPITAM